MEGLVERRILPIAIERCEESPVVLLEGPRTVGKSTLLRTMAERLGGEVLDLDVAGLRRWVKAARIGTLEIKCRAIDIDPATLRRQLRPRGPGMATLILARTIRGAKAFIVERLPR